LISAKREGRTRLRHGLSCGLYAAGVSA
jgi:hypothetical protein